MSGQQIILRVEATYDLTVEVGDRVRRGERLSRSPESDATSAAPVAGTVKSIQFDPERHEFVIVIVTAT
jgi:Na+-translocating ferredoxin:NAD+ oxidoreductase RnfC subunit